MPKQQSERSRKAKKYFFAKKKIHTLSFDGASPPANDVSLVIFLTIPIISFATLIATARQLCKIFQLNARHGKMEISERSRNVRKRVSCVVEAVETERTVFIEEEKRDSLRSM